VALAAVFALKLAVMLQLKDHVLTQPDAGLDTTAYVALAERVLGGDPGLGPGLYFLSPLYIYFLAAVLAVWHSFTAVRLLQIVLGTGTVALVFVSADGWFGRRAAWLAAGLATLTGLFTFYESLLLQTALDPFLTAAALACLTLAARGETPAAFGRRCIPADCVAPPSNIPDILGRRALSAGRLAALGATPDFHHGLLGGHGRHHEIVLAQTPVELCAREPETLRGLRLVPGGVAHHLLDCLALDEIQIGRFR
jgi:hypothetical protein